MDSFLEKLLGGSSTEGVIDLCLDQNLIQLPHKFTHISGLAPFTDLQTLSISGHALTTPQGLPQLPHLHTLSLALNELESLQGLPQLPVLDTLDLSHNLLTELQDLPPLPALLNLDLAHNYLQDTSFLQAYPTLRTLSLSGNRRLHTLQGISSLTLLYELYLKQCLITDWSHLSDLTVLHTLSISPATLQDIHFPPALQTLLVHGHRLPASITLPPMQALQAMRIYQGPQITHIHGLAQSPKLLTLSLRNLGLSTPPALQGLDHLLRLDLSHNPLQDLHGISDLPNLETLDLRNTPVPASTITQLLKAQPHLQIL